MKKIFLFLAFLYFLFFFFLKQFYLYWKIYAQECNGKKWYIHVNRPKTGSLFRSRKAKGSETMIFMLKPAALMRRGYRSHRENTARHSVTTLGDRLESRHRHTPSWNNTCLPQQLRALRFAHMISAAEASTVFIVLLGKTIARDIT